MDKICVWDITREAKETKVPWARYAEGMVMLRNGENLNISRWICQLQRKDNIKVNCSENGSSEAGLDSTHLLSGVPQGAYFELFVPNDSVERKALLPKCEVCDSNLCPKRDCCVRCSPVVFLSTFRQMPLYNVGLICVVKGNVVLRPNL